MPAEGVAASARNGWPACVGTGGRLGPVHAAGLRAARERGRKGGRPRLPADHPRVVVAHEMYRDGKLTIDEICGTLQISRSTFYRYCAIANAPTARAGRTWMKH